MKELVKTTRKIEVILSGDKDVSNYFKEEIQWLIERRRIWENSLNRVAFIGITSCGKSKLINAIIKREPLPIRVKPSSNALVICRWGSKYEGVVHFENGSSKKFNGKMVDKNLKILADEETNPGNEKGVKEIEVYSPEFSFDRNIEIIDTPGLDAYDLERHEELTMQFLLPSVDAVVFITTAKANADGMLNKHLDTIVKNNKPIILVQNMIDSIQPKHGNGGVVEHTFTDMVEQHYKRTIKLIESIGLKEDSVPIIQTSAVWAVDGRLEESGVPELIETVNKHMKKLAPSILRCRYIQLIRWIEKIVIRESTQKKTHTKALKDELKDINSNREKLNDLLKNANELIRFLIENEKSEALRIKNKLNELSRSNKTGARSIADSIRNWVKNKPILKIIREFQKAYKTLSEEMNIRLEDFNIDLPHVPVKENVNIRETHHSSTYKRKKGGIFNSIWRFFGVGGYKEEKKTWTEVDIDGFRKDVNRIIKARNEWNKLSIRITEKEFHKLCGQLENELDRNAKSINAKLETNTKIANRIEAVTLLSKLLDDIKKKHNSIIVPDSVIESQNGLKIIEKEKDITRPNYTKDFVHISNNIARTRFTAVRDYLLKRTAEKNPEALQNVFISGFDEYSLEGFLDRYWYDFDINWSSEIKNPIKVEGKDGISSVSIYLDENEITNNSKENNDNKLEKLFSKPLTAFMIIDAEQPGSTANDMLRSLPFKLLNEETSLYLVIQNLKGLDNSEQVAEGLIEIRKIIDEILDINPDGVFANDDNTTKSVMIDHLFMNNDRLNTVKDEEIMLRDISPVDEAEKVYVSRIIRRWRREFDDK